MTQLASAQQWFDNNGNPLASGTINTYVSGTTTPKTSYSDVAMTTPNANPVVLDSSGRANIYGAGPYKLVIKNSLGTTVLTTEVTDTLTTGDLTGITSINGGQQAGFRNRIINGDMRIDQKNLGGVVTPQSGITTQCSDYWNGFGNVFGKLSYTRVFSAPPGFKYSTQILVTSGSYTPGAAEQFLFYQAMSELDLSDLQLGKATAQSFTISFWVKGDIAGNYAMWVENSDSTRSYVSSYPVTTTWTKISITIPPITSGLWTNVVNIGFDLGCGSNFVGTAGLNSADIKKLAGSTSLVSQLSGTTLYFTGVQLELGTTSTPFEERPYGTELNLVSQKYLAPVTGALAGLRNKLINGGMTIQQRPNYSFTTTAAAYGGCDMYLTYISASTVSAVSLQTYVGVNTSTGYCHQIGNVTTTGATVVQLQQRMESINSAGLTNAQLTFSGKVYQSTGATQSMTIGFVRANATNDFSSQTSLQSTTAIIPNNTWTTFSFTATMSDANIVNGLMVFASFGLSAQTNSQFFFGDWQLETGPLATPPETRAVPSELALCQRYYETGQIFPVGYCNTGGNMGATAYYKVTKWGPAVVTQTNVSNVNFGTAPQQAALDVGSFLSYRTATGTGNGQYQENWIAKKEL